MRNKTTTASPLIDITLTSTGEELEAPEPCAFDEFRCSSETSLCIDQRWVCDGIADCSEGEDEHELLCGEKVDFKRNLNSSSNLNAILFKLRDLRKNKHPDLLRKIEKC